VRNKWHTEEGREGLHEEKGQEELTEEGEDKLSPSSFFINFTILK